MHKPQQKNMQGIDANFQKYTACTTFCMDIVQYMHDSIMRTHALIVACCQTTRHYGAALPQCPQTDQILYTRHLRANAAAPPAT